MTNCSFILTFFFSHLFATSSEEKLNPQTCLLGKVLGRALSASTLRGHLLLAGQLKLKPPPLQVLQVLLGLDPLLPLRVLRQHRVLDLHKLLVVEIPGGGRKCKMMFIIMKNRCGIVDFMLFENL